MSDTPLVDVSLPRITCLVVGILVGKTTSATVTVIRTPRSPSHREHLTTDGQEPRNPPPNFVLVLSPVD